jgi:serine O-acetyltransferase
MKTFDPYITKILSGSKMYRTMRLAQFLVNVGRTFFCVLAYFCSNREKKQLILSDVGSFGQLLRALVFYKYYRTLFYHRIGAISVLFSWVLPDDKSIILPFSTKLGEQIHFIHNYGCHLNALSIGNNFKCYQYVVIGFSKPGENVEFRPRIGDNVVCATGAVVVGGITIGNNVIIGANSFVNRSVPDNCIVMGNPAHIVKQDGIKCDILL